MWWLFIRTSCGWTVVMDGKDIREWAARSDAVKYAEKHYADTDVRMGLVYGEPI